MASFLNRYRHYDTLNRFTTLELHPFPYHPEVCKGKEQLQPQVVLSDDSIEDLSESDLLFDDSKGMFNFGKDVGFRRLSTLWQV